jgi:hypothetical protein
VPHRLIPGPTPQAITSHQVKNPLPLSCEGGGGPSADLIQNGLPANREGLSC